MVVFERKIYEEGGISVRVLGFPVTQPALNLIKFWARNAPDLRYFAVDEPVYSEKQEEIIRKLKCLELDHEWLESLGIQEIR